MQVFSACLVIAFLSHRALLSMDDDDLSEKFITVVIIKDYGKGTSQITNIFIMDVNKYII